MLHAVDVPTSAPASMFSMGSRVYVTCDDGAVWAAEYMLSQTITVDRPFRRVEVGGRTTFPIGFDNLVDTDGHSWLFGRDDMVAYQRPGTFGPVGNTSPIVAASHTPRDSMVVCEDGSVWVTGENEAGQHGSGEYDAHALDWRRWPVAAPAVSVAATDNAMFAVDADGHLWACGMGSSSTTLGLSNLRVARTPWKAELPAVACLAVGGSEIAVIDTDGHLLVLSPGPQMSRVDHPVAFTSAAVLPRQVVAVDVDGAVVHVERESAPLCAVTGVRGAARMVGADRYAIWLVDDDGALNVKGRFGHAHSDEFVAVPQFGSEAFVLLSELASVAPAETSLETLTQAVSRM